MKKWWNNLRTCYWFWRHAGSYSPWRPKRTEAMKRREVVWALASYADGSKSWIWVCDFCGGNCGQCGLTSVVGNVGFSMQTMVDNLVAGR